MGLRDKISASVAGITIAAAPIGVDKARADAVEVMLGDKKASIDVTIDKALNKDKDFRLFLRGIGSVDYDGKTAGLAIIQPYFTLGKGFAVGGELIADSSGAMPKASVQYFGAHKDFSAFVLLDAGYIKDLDVGLLTTFKYRPKLGGDVKLYTSLESLHAFGMSRMKYGSHKFRAGIDKSGLIVGLGVDLGYAGPKPKPEDVTYNIGIFLRKDF